MSETDYYYLCLTCGKISPFSEWKLLKWNEDGDFLIPVEPGDSDPICVCPHCLWQHTDDDSNPGIMDGTRFQVTRFRREMLGEYAQLWDEHG